MQLTLTAEAIIVLKEAIGEHLSDLRMEIADTDAQAFRDELKRKERHLREILEQLERLGPS